MQSVFILIVYLFNFGFKAQTYVNLLNIILKSKLTYFSMSDNSFIINYLNLFLILFYFL